MTGRYESLKIFVEDTSGQKFECEVPVNTQLSTLAADFFESHGWPTSDDEGKGQRAVVELVDPENPDRTKRLGGEQTIEQAGLWAGAVVRIFPESIAGRVEEGERIRALVADHHEITELAEWNPHVQFTANTDYAPTRYEVIFDYPGFRELSKEGDAPIISTNHRVEIILGAEYPRRPPYVRWLTPIFHPNIRPSDGAVCLGVLGERYLPGFGLARLVTMLAEIVQWRNFDMTGALNGSAAEWANNEEHWHYIKEIGGSPFQGPIEEFLRNLNQMWQVGEYRPRLSFKRLVDEGDKQ